MNAELVRWARETSGLSADQAVNALGLKNVERLHAIETGSEEPSRPLLLKMAKQYRRPLVMFHLPVLSRKDDGVRISGRFPGTGPLRTMPCRMR